nr:cytochrome P450 CYP82D47-like [Ipomoea trifida]
MASIKSSSSLDFKCLFVLCSLSHLSAAQSISSAVFLIAFSYPPKSIHLSQGIKSDTNVSPNNSNRFLMDFKSWLSSATSSSPKSIAMERNLFELFGEMSVSDFIPWLRWMDLGGYEKAMRKTAEEMDCAADRWLKEHRTKRTLKSIEEEDFMDVMLSLFDAQSNQTHPLGCDTDLPAWYV